MKHPYLKILDLANLFVANAPMKKIKKFSSTPLSEHFEVLVRKPAIAERVNKYGKMVNFRILNWNRIIRESDIRGVQVGPGRGPAGPIGAAGSIPDLE